MQEKLPPRLCSEIKLFDLCSLEKCSHNNGRFCVNPVMLERFESISESEDRFPVESYCDSESEDFEESESSDFYSDEMTEDDEVERN